MSETINSYQEPRKPRPPRTGHRAVRFTYAKRIIRDMERGFRPKDDEFVWAAEYVGLGNQDHRGRLIIAMGCLVTVFNSSIRHRPLDDDDLVKSVSKGTKYIEDKIDPVFNWLFENRYLQLSRDRSIGFGTAGYWLFEDIMSSRAEMSEPESDTIAARNLQQNGFFPEGFDISTIVKTEDSYKPWTEEERAEYRDRFYGALQRQMDAGQRFSDHIEKTVRDWSAQQEWLDI